MHLQSLSLATLGLLFMANGRFGALADPASQGSAIAFDGQELSGDYLSAFSLDNLEDNDVDFELSEEIADTHVNIAKRADCSKLYTGKPIE
jgi:hypothetical protein